MNGGVGVDRNVGEGGADVDGHQDMKLEGSSSALEEVSTPSLCQISTTEIMPIVNSMNALLHSAQSFSTYFAHISSASR